MTAHLIFRSAIFLSLFGFGIQSTLAVKNEVNVLDRPASHLNTLFHVGLWVENMEEMLAFLDEVMEYKIVLRAKRDTGGERMFLSDSRGQYIELLSDPDKVQAHPLFFLHPRGRVAGIAHISIWNEDVASLKKILLAKGYEVLGQVPKDFADGYVTSEGSSYRILFIRGPSELTFEFFEVKK
jgi:catechol 2,3-dioxygenase-like lactoylglutathione lyase family enzyme